MATVQLNNVSIERGEGGLVTLQVEVAPEAVRETRERVIREYSRRIRVPGFRPGRIPANIVRRQVGDEAIAQQVSDELVPQAYQQAIVQSELQPLDRAQVDDLTFDALTGEGPLQFTARVIVRPTIELGELAGLEAKTPRVEVTDDDVEKGLEALREENATQKNVEGRGAQNGDILSGELQVFMDGEARSEEPARLRSFVLGESGFIPSIDEHLIGAQLDEERRFDVQYPDDFKDEELTGKAAEFVLKVTAIKEKVLPELDDEFAKKLGLDDVPALRERMRQAIQEGREREARDYVRSSLSQAAAQTVEFEVPTSIVDTRIQNRIHNFEHELSQRNATLDDYLQSTGQTREQLEEQVRDEVADELKQELVLDELARREALLVEDGEIENHYMMMAQAMGRPVEDVVQNLDVNTVRSSILQRKAVDWLVENAVVQEVDAAELMQADELGDAELAELAAAVVDEVGNSASNATETDETEAAVTESDATESAVAASETVSETTDVPDKA
jgi:trigger factor